MFFLNRFLHPKPPVPQESPRSTKRDAEILTIGKEAKACALPVIVAGDLNDVAWSYTTELFMKISGLLDPRRGRGFYSTFHAKYWFLRWPLDHIFCSKHFHLIKLKVLPSIGSDHFPIFVELVLPEGYLKEHEDEAWKQMQRMCRWQKKRLTMPGDNKKNIQPGTQAGYYKSSFQFYQ